VCISSKLVRTGFYVVSNYILKRLKPDLDGLLPKIHFFTRLIYPFMKKIIILLSAVCAFLAVSCGIFSSLTSTTNIGPQDSFVLGNNRHGSFHVNLKNISSNPLNIHLAPIDGGTHSPVVVQPNQKLSLKVDSNTAVVIANQSNENASVELKVVGDTGLSMGYKK
jgi:hypothetical protein